MGTPTPWATCTNKLNGRGRIRTFEGISHQIYSLTPLATWVHARRGANRRAIIGGLASGFKAPDGAYRVEPAVSAGVAKVDGERFGAGAGAVDRDAVEHA